MENSTSTHVLTNVSITVDRGEFVAITGASGAGKSTLLHLLGGLDHPDSGSVALAIEHGAQLEYAALKDEQLSELRNAHIGFIFQFHHLLPEFTALENVMMPALLSGKSTRESHELASNALELVGLSQRLHHKPSQLSGGEQQRAAFGRAIINQPALLLADEPTGNLDAKNSALLLSLLLQYKRANNQTLVVVTHSKEIAQQADRILRIRDGQLHAV